MGSEPRRLLEGVGDLAQLRRRSTLTYLALIDYAIPNRPKVSAAEAMSASALAIQDGSPHVVHYE